MICFFFIRSLSLSLSVSVCLSVSLSLCLSVSLYLTFSNSLSLSLFLSLSICLSLSHFLFDSPTFPISTKRSSKTVAKKTKDGQFFNDAVSIHFPPHPKTTFSFSSSSQTSLVYNLSIKQKFFRIFRQRKRYFIDFPLSTSKHHCLIHTSPR